jgi:hypothetical protein
VAEVVAHLGVLTEKIKEEVALWQLLNLIWSRVQSVDLIGPHDYILS